MQEALGEVLPEQDEFEPAAMTPDDLVIILVEFFSKVLFLVIVDDAGNAWNKAPSEQRTIEAENQLFDIIRTSVDNHLSPIFDRQIQDLTKDQIEALERRAIDDLWSEWEDYE